MATPIKQHTIESYNIYSIVYGSNDSTRTKIPMNPRYLIPLLKNDARQIAAYQDDITKSIEDYQFSAIGPLKFTLTINVVDNEMSIESFINDVLFKKYDYSNYTSIKKLLTISSCTKSLLLSVLYILYYGDYESNEDLINLKFLNDVDELQPVALYNYVLDQLNRLIVTTNPIPIEDYIPTIEVEEMPVYTTTDLPYIDYHISNQIKMNTPNSYSNIQTLTGDHIYIKSLSDVKVINRNWTELFTPDINSKHIYSYSEIGTNHNKWTVSIDSMPTESLLKIERNNITNNTKNLIITFPVGFVYHYKHGLFGDKQYDRLEKPFRLKPGETVCLNDTIRKWYMITHHDPIDIDERQNIVVEKFNNYWHNDLYVDREIGSLKTNIAGASKSGTAAIQRTKELNCLTFSGNKVTNNTKHTTFIFPKNYKYNFTRSWISYTPVVETVVKTVIVETLVTIVSWIDVVIGKVWNWFLGLFQPKTERKKQEETIIERTEKLVEERMERLVASTVVDNDEIKLSSSITLYPGKTITLPRATKYSNWDIVYVEGQSVTIKQYVSIASSTTTKIIGVGNDAKNNPLAFKTQVILDKSTASYIDINNTTKELSMDVPVEYTDYINMKDYSATAKFVITDANLDYKDIQSAKNQTGKINIFSKYTQAESPLLYNYNKTLGFTTTHDGTQLPAKKYTNVIKLALDVTVDDDYNVTSKKYAIDSTTNMLELIPDDYNATGTITIKGTYTMIFGRTTDTYKEFQEYVVSKLMNIKKLDVDANYEKDVLYHINAVNIKPQFTIDFAKDYVEGTISTKSSKTSKNSKFALLGDSLETLNSITGAFKSLSVQKKTTEELKELNQMYADANLFMSHTNLVYRLPTSATQLGTFTSINKTDKDFGITNLCAGTFSPDFGDAKILVDVSSYNLYYYNGSIYQK